MSKGTAPGKPGAAPVRLNLGAGRDTLSGWVNVDQTALPGIDVIADLNRCREVPLPFADASVDDLRMYHVIEHLTEPLPLMQELHRIAKPGAKITIRTPYGSNDDAWTDQTHVRAYFLDSWGFFSQPYQWRSDTLYRGDWEPEEVTLAVDLQRFKGLTAEAILQRINTDRNIVAEMEAVLRKVWPIRAARRDLQRPPRIIITDIPRS
ncbi:MAG: methyltransferase domain-containing protein [Xanthobacteraceae bacterium]|nr:methyltransferase domain-containing protein [Xanthobacteraceae bacterium]